MFIKKCWTHFSFHASIFLLFSVFSTLTIAYLKDKPSSAKFQDGHDFKTGMAHVVSQGILGKLGFVNFPRMITNKIINITSVWLSGALMQSTQMPSHPFQTLWTVLFSPSVLLNLLDAGQQHSKTTINLNPSINALGSFCISELRSFIVVIPKHYQ